MLDIEVYMLFQIKSNHPSLTSYYNYESYILLDICAKCI